MAETLKPEINIPLTVGPLSYDTPKAYPPREHNGTQYGASWGYGTPSGTFYADEKCQAAIVAAGVARKGAIFTVLKGKESDGKTNKWTITGVGAAPSSNGRPATAAPRPAASLTFADISFAYRECLFAASAHLGELAELRTVKPADGGLYSIELVPFEVIQSAAATMLIQADRAGCLPRKPKDPPKLDGEHTKEFMAWIKDYFSRADIAPLWPGKDKTTFICNTAGMESSQAVAEANDPALYQKIKDAVLIETANRQAQLPPMESGEADEAF